MTPSAPRDDPALAPAAPSIRRRLASALAGWSLAWALAVGAAIVLTAGHEVDELLDGALKSSAELLSALVVQGAAQDARRAGIGPVRGREHFAWQITGADGALQGRSARAPSTPWAAAATTGFSDAPGWRIYGVALPDGRMFYAAQTLAERREARFDVGRGAVLATLLIAAVVYVWLRLRLRAELQPLQRLSGQLEALSFDDAGAVRPLALGPAQRRELQPVHDALEALISRLAARVGPRKKHRRFGLGTNLRCVVDGPSGKRRSIRPGRPIGRPSTVRRRSCRQPRRLLRPSSGPLRFLPSPWPVRP